MAQSNQLPEDSIHPPKLDNPSPSEGLRGVAQSNEQRGEELRARVLLKMTALALNFRDLVSDDMPSLQESTNDMVQLILADRKQHELDARIDEWKAMGDFLTKADKEALSREFLDLYRLHGERLKAEREAL